MRPSLGGARTVGVSVRSRRYKGGPWSETIKKGERMRPEQERQKGRDGAKEPTSTLLR